MMKARNLIDRDKYPAVTRVLGVHHRVLGAMLYIYQLYLPLGL